MDREPLAQQTPAWPARLRWWDLPVVWSNCLAGVWLGGYWPGAERWDRIAILLLGVSALHTAGAVLDDGPPPPAADSTAMRAGLGLLAGGIIVLGCLGWRALVFALALGGLILLCRRWRSYATAGAVLMSGFLLYPLASAASSQPALTAAAGEGCLLTLYALGWNALAHGERSSEHRPSRWPWVLIVLPIVVNAVLAARLGPRNAVVVALPIFWVARVAFGRTAPLGLGRAASLRVGTVLVDLSAVVACTAFLPWLGWFAILFAVAVSLPRLASTR